MIFPSVPVSHIGNARRLDERTLAMPLPLLPLAVIYLARMVGHLALAIGLAEAPVAPGRRGGHEDADHFFEFIVCLRLRGRDAAAPL